MRAAPLPRELPVRAGLFGQNVRARRRGLLRGVAFLGPTPARQTNGGRALVATSGLLLVVLAFVLLESAGAPEAPLPADMLPRAAQTVALLRKITYDRDFGQGNLQAPARLAALLGDIALFDVGLFKPTCVTSFGLSRQLLLQLGVVVVGAVVVFVPIYARIMAQLKKDSTYRSYKQASLRLLQGRLRPGGVLRGWARSSISSTCSGRYSPTRRYVPFGATPTGTWHPRHRSDAASRTARSGVVCLLVFVVPVPIILEVTVRREYELRGGVHAPHVQALFGWSCPRF